MAKTSAFYCHGCNATKNQKEIPCISTFYPGLHFCSADCIGMYETKIQEKLKSESVKSPKHYNQGGIECIDAIKAALTPEEFRGFCKGNAIMYCWREKHKGGSLDLEKAAWYLAKLKEAKS